MKLGIRMTAMTGAAILALTGLAQAAPRALTIDQTHSEVGFNIRHFFNKTHGRFERYNGTITFDEANVAASTVEVTIQDSSIYTANERRDGHLRTEDFFWADKHPTITFKSTKVVPGKTKDRFQVVGNLTIRGITKPATLDVEYLGMGPVTIGGQDTGTQVGFDAKTTVNRKDYGIVWNKSLDQGGVMLGDDVEIVLSIAAVDRSGVKPPPKPAAAAAPKAADKAADKTADKK